MQSTPSYSISTRSIVISIHLRLGLPGGLFPSGYLTHNPHAVLFSYNRAMEERPPAMQGSWEYIE
jgi:hypothetical protein